MDPRSLHETRGLVIHQHSLVDWRVWLDGVLVATIENVSGYKRSGVYMVTLEAHGGRPGEAVVVPGYREAIALVKARLGHDGPARRWGKSQHQNTVKRWAD